MLTVLELYSGIGGFHFALDEIKADAKVIAAVDINDVANRIYKHNFPDTPILQRCIESLTVGELDKLSPDLIHMSPPCQPYVRVGKQEDKDDERTKSFLHLIDIIPQMKTHPKYMFMENVKGFDTSETRDIFLQMLKTCGYVYQEFLLSPLQFGIPNSRLRYYLMAKKSDLQFTFDTTDQILEELPFSARQLLVHRVSLKSGEEDSSHVDAKVSCPTPVTTSHQHLPESEVAIAASDGFLQEDGEPIKKGRYSPSSVVTVEDISATTQTGPMTSLPNMMGRRSDTCSATDSLEYHRTERRDSESIPLYKKCQNSCRPVANFLEDLQPSDWEKYMVPAKFLRRFWVMDIVQPHFRNSCCFTKRYGHHIEGAGSVIQMAEPPGVDLSQFKKDRVYTEEVEEGVKALKLRFFTPREIANLMCFPERFEFPPDVSTVQCYRVLGNSLNVHVVSVLVKLLLLNRDDDGDDEA